MQQYIFFIFFFLFSDQPKIRESPPQRNKTFNYKICLKCNRRAAVPSEVNASEVNRDEHFRVNLCPRCQEVSILF